jgi:hypothetical protein
MGIFVLTLFAVLRPRKNWLYSISCVAGLITFAPPTDADFDVLEKTSSKPKTNMKGETRKNQKNLEKKQQSKFPMRTMEISRELLQFNQDFFEVYDFVFLMFIVTSIMFLVISILRVLPVGSFIQTNLTFYILVLQLCLWIVNLCRNSFNLGYFSYTDETKLQLVMAIKAFIIT